MSRELKRRVLDLEARIEGDRAGRVVIVTRQMDGTCSFDGCEYSDEATCRAAIGPMGAGDLTVWLSVKSARLS